MLSLNLSDENLLSTVRSAQCLQLDLTSKLSKKKEIKLLNAKLRQLKQKCKMLRQQSKTQREMLSNLMNKTQTLEEKTNSGIQACKQVCTQMLDNHTQLAIQDISKQQKNDKLTDLVLQNYTSVVQLILQSNCSQNVSLIEQSKKFQNQMQNNKNLRLNLQNRTYITQNNMLNIEKLEFRNQPIQKKLYEASTSRSFASSLKQRSDKRQQKILPQDQKIPSTTTLPSQQGSSLQKNDYDFSQTCEAQKIKQTSNSIDKNSEKCSSSPQEFEKESIRVVSNQLKNSKDQLGNQIRQLKSSQIYLQKGSQIYPLKGQKKIKNSSDKKLFMFDKGQIKKRIRNLNQNYFINYFYAVTVVIILTIVFTLTFF